MLSRYLPDAASAGTAKCQQDEVSPGSEVMPIIRNSRCPSEVPTSRSRRKSQARPGLGRDDTEVPPVGPQLLAGVVAEYDLDSVERRLASDIEGQLVSAVEADPVNLLGAEEIDGAPLRIHPVVWSTAARSRCSGQKGGLPFAGTSLS
jgi:hypothetical protein